MIKKQKILITIFATLAIFIIMLVASMTQIGQPVGGGKYPSGRDTYRAFGDGRIQIMWRNSNSKDLFDCENQKIILDRVDLWVKKDSAIFFEGLLDNKSFIAKYALSENKIYLYEKINF